ncbi:hypothetical protein [Williamsia serinedens]|uniref:Uncharacterized protein n=1 Tax=Williamsia serinedens TaxID=391736 RepID=A0ABT1H5X8_9NOCA|nr:hypothetical protein [Williamsia serinedens]MCP2162644.1 hypothetical protein [Williamsia serinedens]
MATQNVMAATSALPGVLVSKQIENAETTQYTGPANSSVKLGKATLANPTASAVTVSVSIVKSGGTAGAANRVVAGLALAAGDSVVLSEIEGHFLGPGDLISAIAGTATAVVLVISGVVLS